VIEFEVIKIKERVSRIEAGTNKENKNVRRKQLFNGILKAAMVCYILLL
jgi:hypothetical protein